MSIITTHVGSLPREQEVVDQLFAREPGAHERGENYDLKAFDEVMTRGVESVVKKQIASEIDIVSDGETSKISYSTYVKDRYHGFSGDSPRNPLRTTSPSSPASSSESPNPVAHPNSHDPCVQTKSKSDPTTNSIKTSITSQVPWKPMAYLEAS